LCNLLLNLEFRLQNCIVDGELCYFVID